MGRLSKLLRSCAMAALALSAIGTVQATKYPLEASPSVVASSSGLTVNGTAYHIDGVAYSPVPVGESVGQEPFGDYFTPDYAYIWARDLPAIKAAGFNTVRIYSWANSVDHSAFLDALQQFGLKAIVTFYVKPQTDAAAAWTKTEQDAMITEYSNFISLYGDHPAVLVWAFGNELNGQWIGIVQKFDTDTSNGQSVCNWQYSAPGGGSCYNLTPNDWAVGSACDTAAACMYGKFYGWLSRAGQAGKQQSTRPQTSTFADVDYFMTGNPNTDRLARFGSELSGLDVVTVQVYRGSTFGQYFTQFAAQTTKPLLIGEYGADAYNDPCGWPENNPGDRGAGPCTNYFMQSGGVGGESGTGCSTSGKTCTQTGVAAQAAFDKGLLNEMLNGPAQVIGGVLMEWHDSYWKNQDVQDKCDTPCSVGDATTSQADINSNIDTCYQQVQYQSAGVKPANCSSRAHITCGNYLASYHDVCGYFLNSAPDSYVNEAWFGLNGVTDCGTGARDANGGHRLSALLPRQVLTGLNAGASPIAAQTCTQLQTCYDCVKAATPSQQPKAVHTADDVVQGKCNSACGLNFNSNSNGASGSNSNGSSGSSNNNGATTGTNNNGGGTSNDGTTTGGATAGGNNNGNTNNGTSTIGDNSAAMSVQSSVLIGAALATAVMLL